MERHFPTAVRRAVLLLAVLVVLFGCAVTGGDADPPSAETVSIQGIPTLAWSAIMTQSFGEVSWPSVRYAAYYTMWFGWLNASLIEGLLQATLAGWTPDQPSTYMVGDYLTFTWAHDGNTWTWTITDTSEGTVTYALTLTATSSGWDVAFSLGGQQWLSGSINNGGSQGTAVLVDLIGDYSGSITTVWEPGATPYEWEFTITATGDFASDAGNGASTATVLLETDMTGDNWYWEYSDNGTDPGPGFDFDEYPGQQVE